MKVTVVTQAKLEESDKGIMNKKNILLCGTLLTGLLLTGCHTVTPDDQRDISQQEISAAVNPYSTAVSTAPPVESSLGKGLTDAPIMVPEPAKDSGTRIELPSLTKVTVSKNETVSLYAGQLNPSKAYKAEIYYGFDNLTKTIDLGSFKPKEDGDLLEKVLIPANIANGAYIVSLESDDGILTVPIKVE